MKTLVLGLGNELRGDDAVGLRVIDYLRCGKKDHSDVHFHATGASGIHLMHLIVSYERVLIVDACEVPADKAGSFWVVAPDQVPQPKHVSFTGSHSMSITSIMKLGKIMGFNSPREVILFLIGIHAVTNPYSLQISENIGAYLQHVIPRVSAEIIATLAFDTKAHNEKGVYTYG